MLFSYFSIVLTWPRQFSRMDRCEDLETVTATLEIPGIEPKGIRIKLYEKKLFVTGNRPKPESRPNVEYSVQELKHGSFEREIDIPMGLQVGFLSLTHLDAYKLVFPRKTNWKSQRSTAWS